MQGTSNNAPCEYFLPRVGDDVTDRGTGSSLACPQYHHRHRDQAHSRLTSAITAPQTPRGRPPAAGDCAGQPLIGTRRAALLGTCARARAPRRDAPSMVEIELSVLAGQCLKRRLPTRTTVQEEIAAWERTRNTERATVQWRFSTEQARTKLHRLSPSQSVL